MSIEIIGSAGDRAIVEDVLASMPAAIPTLIERDQIRYRFLEPRERFVDVDPKYRRMDRPDSEILTYGVYVPEDRIIILRSRLREVCAHETCHHGDALLHTYLTKGTGYSGMRSQRDAAVQAAYKRHRRDGLLISEYSGVNATEFIAESHRAALGFSKSGSRKSDRDRLARIDPALVDLLDAWTEDLRAIAAQIATAA